MGTIEGRLARPIAKGGLVKTLNQITRLLKFNRDEERRRNVDPFVVDAGLVVAAGSYLVSPEGQPTRVRSPIQKILIVLPHEKVGAIDWVAGRGVAETTRVALHEGRDLINRKRAEGLSIVLVLGRQHDGIGTTSLTIAVGSAKVVSNLVGGNAEAKRSRCLVVRKSVRVRRIRAHNAGPGDARGTAQRPTGPKMRQVAYRVVGGKVSLPDRRKLLQDRHGVATGGVRIGCRIGPGVLKHHRECQAYVALIDRLNPIHDSKDVVVCVGRTSQSPGVFTVRFSRNLNHFEW